MKDKVVPVNIIPFKLYNIEPFLQREHPELFPESSDYKDYWLDFADKCIRGMWGLDRNEDGKGGWRFMPNRLFFYMNACRIEINNLETGSEEERPPDLRDIDWLLFYDLLAIEGFSGMRDDEEVTCFKEVGKMQRGEDLTRIDEIRLKRYDKYLRKPTGEYKDYVDPLEYLYKTYDEPKGYPMHLNNKMDTFLFTPRRLGKSLGYGHGIILHNMLFGNSKNLDDYLQYRTKSLTTLGAERYEKNEELLVKLDISYAYIRDELGAYNKDGYNYKGALYEYIDNWTKGFFKNGRGRAITRTPLQTTGSYKGPGSRLANVSFESNASAAASQKSGAVLIEEGGLVGNFPSVMSETAPTQMQGTDKIGFTAVIGTGGNITKIQGIKSYFYNPDENNILSFHDNFEHSGNRIARFVPSPYIHSSFRDDEGNIDLEAAYEFEIEEREKRKKSGNYREYILSFPFYPSEIFMQSGGNIFPAESLDSRHVELYGGEWSPSVGMLYYVDSKNTKCVWEEDLSGRYKPYKEHGEEDVRRKNNENLDGGIVIYEHPKEYNTDRYDPNPLYIAVYDPVSRSEDGSGTSLACVKVFKNFDPYSRDLQYNVVAESYYRISGEGGMDSMHERAFLLADYYNCRLLPETNNEDILRYARRIGRWNDLEDSPSFNRQDMSKRRAGNKKGFYIPTTSDAKDKLAEFYLEVLIREIDSDKEIVGDEVIVRDKKVSDMMPSIRLCEELIKYNSNGNFDGVSCCFLYGIWARNREMKPDIERGKMDEYKKSQEFNNFIKSSSKREVNPAFDW